jgi:hypothetical protein
MLASGMSSVSSPTARVPTLVASLAPFDAHESQKVHLSRTGDGPSVSSSSSAAVPVAASARGDDCSSEASFQHTGLADSQPRGSDDVSVFRLSMLPTSVQTFVSAPSRVSGTESSTPLHRLSLDSVDSTASDSSVEAMSNTVRFDVNDALFAAVKAHTVRVMYAPGQILLRGATRPRDSMFVVLSGKMVAYAEGSSVSRSVAIGEVLGALPALTGGLHTETVRVLSAVEVAVVSVSELSQPHPPAFALEVAYVLMPLISCVF